MRPPPAGEGYSIPEVGGREVKRSSEEDRAGAIERRLRAKNRVDDRTNRPSDKLLCHIVDVRDD